MGYINNLVAFESQRVSSSPDAQRRRMECWNPSPMSTLKMARNPRRARTIDSSRVQTPKRLADPKSSNRAFAVFFIVTILIAITLLLGPTARAASGTWNVSASGNWSNTANWSGGVIADGAGFTGNITFNINNPTTVTIDTTSRTLGILNVGDTNNNNRYTIASSGGATLTFDNTPNSANAQLNQTSTSNGDTISAPILLNSSLDISNADSTDPLTISTGGITSSATSGIQTITNKGTGSGGVSISGVISDGGTGGTVAVTQNSSSSALTLAGATANTYTGLTTVSAGTLNLGKTASVNAFGGDLTINGGAVVYSTAIDNQITDSAKVTISSGSLAIGARTETIGQIATGTSGLALSGTGAITIGSGQLNVANSAAMTGGTITLTAASGAFQLNTDFNFSGGTIDFTSANGGSTAAVNLRGGDGTGITYSASGTSAAQITNSGGGSARVSLNTAAGAKTVFNIADSSSVATELTIGVSITGGSGNALEKTGAGILRVTANNTYLGATIVSGGTFEIANTGSTSSGRISGTSSVTVNSGGTLLLSGSNTFTDRINTSAGVTISGGGTFKTGGLSEGTRPSSAVATDGVAGVGALTLTSTSSGSHATIDFATGANGSSLVFSSLSGGSGAFLDILNWTGMLRTDDGATGNDRLLFATNPGLTETQLANFQFYNDSGTALAAGATIIAYGNEFELVPVPEPSTWFGGALTVGLIGWSQRRRLCSRNLSEFARLVRRTGRCSRPRS